MAENTMYIDRVINHEKAKSRRLGRAKAIKEMAKALLKQDMEIEKNSRSNRTDNKRNRKT